MRFVKRDTVAKKIREALKGFVGDVPDNTILEDTIDTIKNSIINSNVDLINVSYEGDTIYLSFIPPKLQPYIKIDFVLEEEWNLLKKRKV